MMEKVVFFWGFLCRIIQLSSSDVSGDEVTLVRSQLNEGISLNCNMTNRYEIAWYHQNPDSGRLTLLMSAKMSSAAGQRLLVSYNQNKSRLKLIADSGITTASLVISGVSESDSGLYFCGTKSVTSELHFNKPIRLELQAKLANIEDKDNSVTELPEDVEITDEVTVTERVLMFGGVGLAVFVFFLATVAAGGIIHHHGRQKGWKEAKRSFLMRQKSAK